MAWTKPSPMALGGWRRPMINGCWQVIPAYHWFIMVYPSFHKTVLKQVVHSISIKLMFLSAILVLQHVMLKEQMAHVQRKPPFFRGCFLGGESDGYTPHLKPIGALFLFLHVKCNRWDDLSLQTEGKIMVSLVPATCIYVYSNHVSISHHGISVYHTMLYYVIFYVYCIKTIHTTCHISSCYIMVKCLDHTKS